jgi:Tol biopolymer transport system component
MIPQRARAAALTGLAAGLLAGAVAAPPADATPPGRNGRIIWQREPATPRGLPHLWTAKEDGTDARLPFAPVKNRGEVEGTFSPTDPNTVFFSAFPPRPFGDDLFRGDLATRAVTRITRAPSADLAPTVSPDGTRLLYFAVPRPARLVPDRPPPPEQVHVAALDGSGDRRLTPVNQRSFDPDWSPDGTRIAYCQSRLLPRDVVQDRLMIMNADGTGRRALTTFGGKDEINPKWMPDGRAIVFEQLQRTGTRSDIATISPDGGPQRTLLSTRRWETNPVPSPDGKRIVFTSDRDRPGVRGGPGFELYTMAVDGTDIRRLTNNRVPDLFPDWQRLAP